MQIDTKMLSFYHYLHTFFLFPILTVQALPNSECQHLTNSFILIPLNLVYEWAVHAIQCCTILFTHRKSPKQIVFISPNTLAVDGSCCTLIFRNVTELASLKPMIMCHSSTGGLGLHLLSSSLRRDLNVEIVNNINRIYSFIPNGAWQWCSWCAKQHVGGDVLLFTKHVSDRKISYLHVRAHWSWEATAISGSFYAIFTQKKKKVRLQGKSCSWKMK